MKDLVNNWDKIRRHFSQSFRSNLHVAIASVDSENNPTVSPIGTVFLNKDQTGFYFEQFTSSLPKNAKHNHNICILAVNSSKWFWVKSLFKERFDTYPAIKLYGYLGTKRKATQQEMRALERRMRFTKGLKGQQVIWGDMEWVREIHFIKFEKINIGKLTAAL